ncbi:MAG: single-stranded DNA-binding protein [bacterium]
MNSVILTGRLTGDPTLRYTPDGTAVAEFTLAVNRRGREGKELTDFIDIVVWRKQAELCATYLKKGRLIGIEGRLEIDRYQSQDGKTQRRARVVARRVEFLGSRPKEEEGLPEEVVSFDEDAFVDDLEKKIDIDLDEGK